MKQAPGLYNDLINQGLYSRFQLTYEFICSHDLISLSLDVFHMNTSDVAKVAETHHMFTYSTDLYYMQAPEQVYERRQYVI